MELVPLLWSSADANLGTNNWVFFAATYDPTLPADQVKYYFGRQNQLAYLDTAYNYTSTNMDYSGKLTAGNVSTVHPDRNTTANCSYLFRGLIDELRVYTNALTLDEIQEAQLNATVPPTAASFITQPVSVVAQAGGNATFSCVASGSGLVTYQWRTNGVAVPGATNNTWTWSNVQEANNGTTVSVLIDNVPLADPGLASPDVTLTVIPADPKIGSFSLSGNAGIITPNMGSFRGNGRLRVSGGFPMIINTNVPSGPIAPSAAHNREAIHMGLGSGAHRAVDLTNNLISPVGNLGSLNALTICGWLNSGNRTFRTTSSGRGCGIVNASLGASLGGFVLGYRNNSLSTTYGENGRFQFHVNEWNTDGTTANLSSVDTIPLNTNLPPENWVFFAVTYDGLSTANNLTFYFGNADQEATNEVTQTYNKGVIAATGPLAIGNHNCAPGNPDVVMPGNPTGRTVTSNNGAMWRGLIDEIKIYSKVLTLTEIREAQTSPSLPPHLLWAAQTNNLVLSWEGPFQLQSKTTGTWTSMLPHRRTSPEPSAASACLFPMIASSSV